MRHPPVTHPPRDSGAGRRGYTLVELMLTVALVGVLATLATTSLRRALAYAKTAEAKTMVGAIARSASSVYEAGAAVAVSTTAPPAHGERPRPCLAVTPAQLALGAAPPIGTPPTTAGDNKGSDDNQGQGQGNDKGDDDNNKGQGNDKGDDDSKAKNQGDDNGQDRGQGDDESDFASEGDHDHDTADDNASNRDAEGADASHGAGPADRLCGSSTAVPAAVPRGHSYQPNTADGFDFRTGAQDHGWRCLRFEISQPIRYQYKYTKNETAFGHDNPARCLKHCYEAAARGDLDGDGVLSVFALTGHVNTQTGSLNLATAIYSENDTD